MSKDQSLELDPLQRTPDEETIQPDRSQSPLNAKHYEERVRQYWREIQNKQKKLAQRREGVIKARVNLRSTSEKVRKHREKAGDAEAAFMTNLRQFCEQRNDILPPALREQYRIVQEFRDAIGQAEDDYNQDEQKLSSSEWKFIEEEDEFYQYEALELLEDVVMTGSNQEPPPNDHLPAPIPSPADAIMIVPESLSEQYTSALEDVGKLKFQFNKLREEEVGHMEDHRLRTLAKFTTPPEIERNLQDFNNRASDIIDQLVAADAKMRRLRQQLHIEEHNYNTERRASDPSHFLNRKLPPSTSLYAAPSALPSRAQTESAVETLVSDFSSVKQRIGIWMLESLQESPLELSRFKTILANLSNRDLDDESWLQVITHWNDDITNSPMIQEQQERYSVSHETIRGIGSIAKGTEEVPDLGLPTEGDSLPSQASEGLRTPNLPTQPTISLTELHKNFEDRPIESSLLEGNHTLADSAIRLPHPPPRDSCQPSPVMEASSWSQCEARISSQEVQSRPGIPLSATTPTQDMFPDDSGSDSDLTPKQAQKNGEETSPTGPVLLVDAPLDRPRPHSDPGGQKLREQVGAGLTLYADFSHWERQPRTPPILDHESIELQIPTVNEPHNDVPSPPLTERTSIFRSRSPSPLDIALRGQVLRPAKLPPLLYHRRAHSESHYGILTPVTRSPDRPSR